MPGYRPLRRASTRKTATETCIKNWAPPSVDAPGSVTLHGRACHRHAGVDGSPKLRESTQVTKSDVRGRVDWVCQRGTTSANSPSPTAVNGGCRRRAGAPLTSARPPCAMAREVDLRLTITKHAGLSNRGAIPRVGLVWRCSPTNNWLCSSPFQPHNERHESQRGVETSSEGRRVPCPKPWWSPPVQARKKARTGYRVGQTE
jgi:hypothetical protein